MNKVINTAYFIASLQGKDKWGKNYNKIYEILKSQDLEVSYPIKDVSKDEILNLSDDEFKDYLVKNQKSIKESDVFVAEVTPSSSNVGYEVGFAVAHAKPVLLLRHESADVHTAPTFRGNPSKLLTLSYYNEENLEQKIRSFLKKAKKGIFVKRLPIEFTQDQVEYVQYRQGIGTRQSFNATIRQVVDEAALNDEDYKAFSDLS